MKQNTYFFKSFACLLFVVLSSLSLFIGVKSLTVQSLLINNQDTWQLFLTSRLPRTLSIILSSSALSICGVLMQLLMRNRFVSPSVSGVMQWAKLGILVSLILFPLTSLLFKFTISAIFAIVGSLIFVFVIRQIKFKDIIIVPLLGIVFGEIVNAITTFLGMRFGVTQGLGNWLEGGFSSVSSGRYELLYFLIPCFLLLIKYANYLTIVSLGEDTAENLGVSYQKHLLFGMVLSAVMTSLVVTTIGSLSFVGLIVPNAISLWFGDYLRKNIWLAAWLGSCLVLLCDIISRLLIYPYEIPVNLLLGILGSAFFLFYLWQMKKR